MNRESPRPARKKSSPRTAVEDCIDPGLFQALCDPVRIALVARLASADDSLSVTDASECCGIHFSGVSRHLSILKRAGVVRAEKRGREKFYRLETRDIVDALRDVADALERCCGPEARTSK